MAHLHINLDNRFSVRLSEEEIKRALGCCTNQDLLMFIIRTAQDELRSLRCWQGSRASTYFKVKDRLPEPNVPLYIKLDFGEDCRGGGPAMLGEDGKWYWMQNGKPVEEVYHKVVEWDYF